MELYKTFNFLSIKIWRHFCLPFSLCDTFKCYFRDGQAKPLIPVLSNGMLIGVFWNHNLVLQSKWRRHTSLRERSCPEFPPNSISPTLECPLQGETKVVLQRNGKSNSSLDDMTRGGPKRLAHFSKSFYSEDTFYLISHIL